VLILGSGVRRGLIEREHPELSLRRQCELLSLARSGIYYKTEHNHDDGNTNMMNLIDTIYTKHPFFGYRRITAMLRRLGYAVNGKRIIGLMRRMSLEAIYPKKNTSIASREHWKYPYLLNEINVTRPGQVWATDITYIRMRKGYLYLMAIMDWHSRYVLSWRLSNTLDVSFCIDALEEALLKYVHPEIFNSDQGCQFTSETFTKRLIGAGIRISMDGKGRCHDNIFVERLWRSLKYEEVFLKDYCDGIEAAASLNSYFRFYNFERPHQALGYKTPQEVYVN
jgi:putative transposase